MLRPLLLLLVLFSLISCASGPGGNSRGMQEIVRSLRVDPYNLDLSGMYRGSPEEFEIMRGRSHMEIYRVPTRPGNVDAFQYTVYYNKSDKQYWVTRSGGIAGVSELYGPVDYPPTPKFNDHNF